MVVIKYRPHPSLSQDGRGESKGELVELRGIEPLSHG